MEFENYKATYLQENKKLKIALAITLIISSITTLSIMLQKRYFLYKGSNIFEERPLAIEICRLGFMSLANGNPNSHVITGGIIELVKNNPFHIEVEKVLKLESLEERSCKIILKTKKKLLAFKINLNESSFYPFHYKINQLDQLAIAGVK